MAEDTRIHRFPRGLIIVDSSALKKMNLPISLGESSAGEERYYLNMLPVLAKAGFRVAIPEIVSLESAGMLKGGIDLDSYFHNRQGFDNESIKAFLRKVARDEYKGIHIIGSYDAPEYIRDYVNRFHDAVRQHGDEVRLIKENYRNMKDYVKLNYPERKKKDGLGLGDDVIESLLRNQYASKVEKHSVFVLTDDNNLIERIGGRVNAVTPRQLVRSFVDAGMHTDPAIGMSPQTTKEAFEADMLQGDGVSAFQRVDEYKVHPFHSRLRDEPAKLPGGEAVDMPGGDGSSQAGKLAAERMKYWGLGKGRQ